MTATHSAATNTEATYGWVERAFHWAIAIGIVLAVALGKLAHDAPFATDAELARKAWLFSFHKTVGVTIFFVALARIGWALAQPRPRPMHPKRRAETLLAATVHWLLYGSLLLVPALGWAEHAATTGFAPIWWPFGQGLPFVPVDPELAKTLATLHTTFVKVLVAAVLLHVVGALKHVFVDRDLTLARMWRGADPGPLPASGRHVLPLVAALGVWGATLAVGLALVPAGAPAAPQIAAETTARANWTVEEGTLSITVTQMGAPVTGRFADWQAAIDFDETPRADGTLGTVEAVIGTGSLTLGSVTTQATGPEFLDAAGFPTARFDAVIRAEGDGYVADGTFGLRGVEIPLVLPFTLQIDGDRATMAGQVALDRRDFGMGAAYPDETNVGFGVTIDVALIALRDG
ncbi:cytochrome b/b6 domain-containing protein [Jannaschia ovalis]|uniref:Cytochrome b/b6 domain-containing protein n=1 Tax=Jannaschia ovalis TaxID=3038773 RepID=A0ABY8LDU9_9RHOB|nr:cytochrome b/b6 domain-containing protein [Jannaschia sp. GRR-S6-38]WGH78343.1 cytochrome b/b6 domain-containing protein [Jannaschia sp. GRR-S6-38]